MHIKRKYYIIISIFFSIVLSIFGYLYYDSQKQSLLFKVHEDLMKIASSLEGEFDNEELYRDLKFLEGQNIKEQDKVLWLNVKYQQAVNKISKQYPGYRTGVFVKDTYRLIAVTNVSEEILRVTDFPPEIQDIFDTGKSKVSIFISPTTKKKVVNIQHPIKYAHNIIGMTWASFDYDLIQLKLSEIVIKIIYIMIIICFACLFCTYSVFETLFRTILSLIEQVKNGSYDISNYHGFPEFIPLMETIQSQNQSLAAQYRERELILESIGDMFMALDRTLTITYANSSAKSFFGRNMVGEKITDILGIQSLFCQMLHRAIESKENLYFETLEPLNDRFVTVSVYPTEISGISVFFRDCTETKQMEQQIKQQKNYLEIILNSVSDNFFSLNKDMVVTYCNDGARRYFYTDLTEKSLWGTLGEISPWYEIFNFVMKERKPVFYDMKNENTSQWMRIHVYPLEDGGLSVFFRDITHIKEMEQRVHDVMSSVTDIIFGLNKKMVVNYMNPAAIEYFQRDLTGYCIENEPFIWEYPFSGMYKKALLEQSAVSFEVKSTISDKWLEVNVYPTKNQGLSVFAKDITEKKRMRQELKKLDELQVISKIAASISHEVRNPLTSVRGFLQFLGRKPDIQKYQSQFALMIEELDRATTIIEEFLSAARIKKAEQNMENINNILIKLQPILQADALKNDHEIEIIYGEVPDLLLSSKEIKQMIINFVRNAFEAMDKHGKVLIKTWHQDGQVILAIKDTGKGIPDQILEKIGNPFVTTKEMGTGLGLAVCYGIAETHGATISLTTSTEGTDFYIHFPVASNTGNA